MEFRFSDIAKILDHQNSKEEDKLVITGFSTDTRTLEQGAFFVAIPGENFDGGKFVEKALGMGASGAVTERKLDMPGVISVENSIRALGSIAGWHRESMTLPLIAVTGSTGKTSTRNFINSVLSVKYRVHSTEGNLNNHIGLPMTLLKIDDDHEISVIEMGMNNLGEIDYLSSIAKPDTGVITNIGMSHIGMLGSMENIFRAKTEMIPHIKKGGTLVINGDDEFLSGLSNKNGPSVMTFGADGSNDIVFNNTGPDEKGCYSFDIEGYRYKLGVKGYHSIYNAVAAIAVGKLYGMTDSEIQEGLSGFENEKMRLNIYDANGMTIIDDAYNASPDSMISALGILKDFRGRHIAVLGDMLEMGEFSQKAHLDAGKKVKEAADLLICCGTEAKFIAKGAVDAGMEPESVMIFSDSDEAGDFLSGNLKENDVILIKGSRGMKMENVIKYIEVGGS